MFKNLYLYLILIVSLFSFFFIGCDCTTVEVSGKSSDSDNSSSSVEPRKLTSTTPTNGATEVSRISPIVLTFGETVSPGSTNGTITLESESDMRIFTNFNDPYLTYDETNITLRLLPPLSSNTKYTVSFAEGVFVQSVQDNETDKIDVAESSFSFTTRELLEISGFVIANTNGFYETDADDGSFSETITISLLGDIDISNVHQTSGNVFGISLQDRTVDATVPVGISGLADGLSIRLSTDTNTAGKVTALKVKLTDTAT